MLLQKEVISLPNIYAVKKGAAPLKYKQSEKVMKSKVAAKKIRAR